MYVPDLLDGNGKLLLKSVDEDIKELQKLLNIGQEKNPPPGPPPGSEDRGNIMTDTEVRQNGITTMGGSTVSTDEGAFDDEALIATGNVTPIQIEGYGSRVQNYVNQNPTAIRTLMEEYEKVRNNRLSADYNTILDTINRVFGLNSRAKAIGLAEKLFEASRPSEEPTTPTTNRRNRRRNRRG